MAQSILQNDQLSQIVGGALKMNGENVSMSMTVMEFCNTYSSYQMETFIKSKLPFFVKWDNVKNLSLDSACNALGGEEKVQEMLDSYLASLGSAN